jgi:Lrp/AsnC family transcriptional regulator for asnA, asnC and gidA
MQNRINIDAIDAKILKTLLKEARTTFTDIAKDCKISVVAVRTRYNHLKKLGVINGEIMQVNPYSLGYKCVGNIGINTSTANEKAVIEFLKKKFPSVYPVSSWGKYNIGIRVVKKNVQEWAEALHSLDSNPYIKLADPLIWASPTGMDHPENLVIKPLDNKIQEGMIEEKPIIAKNEQIQLDEIDRQIAKMLVYNSRISFRSIATQLDISTQQVIQRYKKLRGTVLTLSAITLDLKKLGYSAAVSIYLKVERNKMQEISDKILQIPNMIAFIRLLGSYDINALAALDDFNSLLRLQREIRALEGVELVQFFVMEIWRSFPPNVFASLLE